MAKQNAALLSFNRGEVSRKALARVDVERLRLAAETQENFLPSVLGPMMLRPGLGFVGSVNRDLRSRVVPFVFSNSDVALIELSAGTMRVWVDDALVTRGSVSTNVANGNFSSSAGWTLSGSTAAIANGVLTLATSSAGALATCYRPVSVATGDRDKEHALRVIVRRGPIQFRAGSTLGGGDYIDLTTLETGEHSLSFTPSGDFYVQFETSTARQKIIESVAVESAGVMEIATTWSEADLADLRFDQSGDVIFVACKGQRQSRIERRSTTSWSVARYDADNGPFLAANATDITLTAAALTGNTTLTASRALWKATHVGALIRHFSSGQTVTASITAQNIFTSTIRVSGVGTARSFALVINGIAGGTVVTLQRSVTSASAGFSDVQAFSANTSNPNFNDGLDNLIAWYRIGVKAAQFGSGTAIVSLTYSGGGQAGIARVTSIDSALIANVEVLRDLGSTSATDNWSEGEWSDLRGWPSAVTLFDGRLWWAGRDRIWGSVSDDYASFDADTEGDAGPISRSLGSGPVDTINWVLPLSRLIVGREGSEVSVRSSSFDEPLTPTNLTLKDASTQGSTGVAAVKVDTRGVFVEKSNRKVYELAFSPEIQDYAAHDLTRLHPDIGLSGFVDVAVQRQPDTMLHFVLGNGEAAILLYDREDQVEAWWRIVTDGAIESVAILPGAIEDKVYYVVKRNIDGFPRRFLEKLARRDDCVGGQISKLADSFVVYEGSATVSIGNLTHLENSELVLWADGKDVGRKTVRNGAIALDAPAARVVAGLPYEAAFKSAKLAYAAVMGTALTQKKRVDHLGLILFDTHCRGLRYGQDFEHLDDMPLVKEGAVVNPDTVFAEFDAAMIELPGHWDTDARLCLKAAAPRPCTLAAAVVAVTTHEKG